MPRTSDFRPQTGAKSVTAQTAVPSDRTTDSEYLSMIEKYKGSPYYQQLLNNPYLRSNNAEFSPTLWQQFAGLFGDNAAESAYYEDLMSKRNQYFSDILAQMNEYELNKPINQVALEKQAGLNPDLVGLSSVQPAPGNDQPVNGTAMQSAGVNQSGEEIQRFGQMGISFITTLFNLGQSVQNFQSNAFAIAGQEIKNNKDAKDFVIESIAQSAPFKDVNELDDASINQLSDYVIDAASKADYSGYSPYTRKLIKRTFAQYDRLLKSGKDTLGVASLKAELRNKFVSNQTAAAKQASQLGFSEGFQEFVKWFADNYSQKEFELSQKLLEVEKAELNARKTGAAAKDSENRYNKNYFDYANSQGLHRKSVDAEAKSYEAQEAANDAQKIINQTWDDTIRWLSKGDEWYNSLGVLAAAYFRSMSLHIPSINVSGPKSTTNYITKDSHDYHEKTYKFANQ